MYTGFRKLTFDGIDVKIPNVDSDGSYGSFMWPSAVLMAEYLCENRHLVEDKIVLEMSAGMAMPGILSAKLGSSMCVIHDRPGSSLKYMQDLATLNGFECHTMESYGSNTKILFCEFLWGDFSNKAIYLLPQVDVIISSDCFYAKDSYRDILATVSWFMLKNPQCRFYTVYHERSVYHNIILDMRYWGLTGHVLDMSEHIQERIANKYTDELVNKVLHDLHIIKIKYV